MCSISEYAFEHGPRILSQDGLCFSVMPLELTILKCKDFYYHNVCGVQYDSTARSTKISINPKISGCSSPISTAPKSAVEIVIIGLRVMIVKHK